MLLHINTKNWENNMISNPLLIIHLLFSQIDENDFYVVYSAKGGRYGMPFG